MPLTVFLNYSNEFLNKKEYLNKLLMISPFIKKIIDIKLEDHNKSSFKKLDFIIFDNNSTISHHIKSFSSNEKDIRCKKNFSLRINSLGNESYHIRMGININIDTNLATIIDLIKKTG